MCNRKYNIKFMDGKKEELREIKKGETGTGLLIENDGYVSIHSTPHNRQIKEDFDNRGDGWYVPNPFIVDAVFQKYDTKNANGRIYPEKILKKQVELYQQKINERRALGECNHPSDSTIDLGRVSHNIVELHWENKTLVGKMELNVSEGFRKHGICSSLGDTVALLLLNGYKIGVSSRGLGSVEQRLGQTIVGDDFDLICWDVVSDPSTPGSYISMDGPGELIQYVENKTGYNASPLNEKISKIEKILND